MKYDNFTIFLLLLGVLVIITLVMNYRPRTPQEPFVDFHGQLSTGTAVYIPQYSADSTRTVISLYDNLYFDTKNGSLIEVFAPACATGCNTTGKSITKINVAQRDGAGVMPLFTTLDVNGNIQPYDSIQSKQMVIQPLYSAYLYSSSCPTTSLYQVIYISWNTDTYVHIIDLSASATQGTSKMAFHMNSSGTIDSYVPTTTPLQPYTSITTNFVPVNGSSLTPSTITGYGTPMLTLGADDASTPNRLYYDVTNGNIVTSTSAGLKAYTRRGDSVSNLTQPGTLWNSSTTLNHFIINDIPGLSVIIFAYKNDTAIVLLQTDGDKYKVSRH